MLKIILLTNSVDSPLAFHLTDLELELKSAQ